MENNKDKPYSLQDAQDKESQLAGYRDFDSFYKQNAKEHVYGMMKEAAELYASKATEELRKENEALLNEISNLNTVMIAAAEEIQAHWKAHCDEDGYGPANLMHRLEKGIPAQYGYTAGAFESLEKEVERLKEYNKELVEALKRSDERIPKSSVLKSEGEIKK